MKYITVTQPLEAQVGGVFHNLTPGSHNVEDAVADFLVSNYADRGVSFGVRGGVEPVKPVEEAATEVAEPDEPAAQFRQSLADDS